VAFDSSGPALRACLVAGVDLIKPNVAELEELVGARLGSLGEVIAAAQGVIGEGARAALVSLGPDGALYVDRDCAVHAEAVVTDVVNTVGAGDALLAGYLAADGGPDAIATAVAWSVAAIRSGGTWMRRVGPADHAAVRVHRAIDRSRPLREPVLAAS
jgi:1-phosphofructokinase